MSANSKPLSDKEKVWKKLTETEHDRQFNEILQYLAALATSVEEVSGHKKDEK